MPTMQENIPKTPKTYSMTIIKPPIPPKALAAVLERVPDFRNYHPVIRPKTQICLHHTAGSSAGSAIGWWRTRLRGKGTVSTPYVIERNGTIYQLYEPDRWGNHINASADRLSDADCKRLHGSKALNSCDEYSIGIELVSLGGMKAAKGSDVVQLATPWRGFKCYQAYTVMQIRSLSLLLPYLCDWFRIPTDVIGITATNAIDIRALLGVPGIYSHADYRPDKSDVFSQPELLNMLYTF